VKLGRPLLDANAETGEPDDRIGAASSNRSVQDSALAGRICEMRNSMK
jgi:hypothetical protein